MKKDKHSWMPVPQMGKEYSQCRVCGMMEYREFAYGKHFKVWTKVGQPDVCSLYNKVPKCPGVAVNANTN